MKLPLGVLFAHALGQLQEEMREAGLDAASGDLGDAAGQLHDPLRHAHEVTAYEGRVLLEELEEHVAADEQTHGALGGDGRGGVGATLVRDDGAQRVAGAEDLEDHLAAAGDQLHDLHAPAHDREEEVRGVALGKDEISLLVRLHDRHRGEPPAIVGRKGAKERGLRQGLFYVGRHHRIIRARTPSSK